MRTRLNSTIRTMVAVVLVGAGLVASASSASAFGGEQGELLLKGPGAVYGQPGALVSLSVAAGNAATFSFEVRNTGSTTSQFNIQISHGADTFCAAACAATDVVSAGSLIVTPSTAGPNGYFTAPIAPGAAAVYTLKITVSKTGATPGDDIGYQLRLADTADNQLGPTAVAYDNVTRSTGNTGADEFVSATGTPPNSGNASSFGIATAPSVAVGKTFTFTVKLMNDSASANSISYLLEMQQNDCAAYFPLKITQGTKNVTAAAESGSYTTATLAHGASVSLAVTGTSLAGGEACLQTYNEGYATWYSASLNGNGGGNAYLEFTPAAT